MNLKVKLLKENSKLPIRATAGSAGLDVTATSIRRDKNNNLMYGLGIAVEIPQGYFGLITSRSSIKDKDLRIIPGIIDSDYTGEIFAVFTETSSPAKIYKIGERVAQLLIMPICNCTITVSEELYESERGQQGFGSTGNEAILVNV